MTILSSLLKGPQENRLQVKQVIEALLFASSSALSLNRIQEITAEISPFKPRDLLEILRELQIEYEAQQRAFELVDSAEGFILRTRPQFAPYLGQLFQSKQAEKISQAAAETLAIIAYKGPITRVQVEALRGVDSSGVIQSLVERHLIAAVGRLETPGKPTLYQVTTGFLAHFGFRTIDDLRSNYCV